MFLLWFILIVNGRPLSVCYGLNVHFIYESLVPICRVRAVLLAFRSCCFYFMSSYSSCFFHVWCLGQEFGCFGSWSLPFHLLYISSLNSSQVKNKKDFSKPFLCHYWYGQQSLIIHDLFTRPFGENIKFWKKSRTKIFPFEDNAFS